MQRSFISLLALAMACSMLVLASGPLPLTSVSSIHTVDTISQDPLDLDWQPVVYGDYFRQCYPAEYESLHAAFIEAVITRQDRFVLPDESILYELELIFKTTFPVYIGLVAEREYRGDAVYFSYIFEPAEHDAYLADFAARVVGIIGDAVQAGDTPTMAALALYDHYASIVTYDYEAIDDEFIKDVSTLRALESLEGICQSFASAYAYLLLQIDINAARLGGLNDAGVAHEWTFVELDGHNYHCDPTYENGMASGLRYFGMTNEERFWQDGYDPLTFNLANANSKMGADIVADDMRFAALWQMDHVEALTRTPAGLEIRYVDSDGVVQTVTFR